MAAAPPPEPEPDHGLKGTLVALLFAGLVLGGAGWATVISTDDHGEQHSDKTEESHDEGEDHGDE